MSFTMDISSYQAVDGLTGAGNGEEIVFFGRTFEMMDVRWECKCQLSLPLFADETRFEQLQF